MGKLTAKQRDGKIQYLKNYLAQYKSINEYHFRIVLQGDESEEEKDKIERTIRTVFVVSSYATKVMIELLQDLDISEDS